MGDNIPYFLLSFKPTYACAELLHKPMNHEDMYTFVINMYLLSHPPFAQSLQRWPPSCHRQTGRKAQWQDCACSSRLHPGADADK